MRAPDLALLALACVTVVAVPASAQTGAAAAGDYPTMTVSTAGLDLSNPHDLAIARRRVAEAATEVCDVVPRTGMLVPQAVLRCRSQAAASANQRLAAISLRQTTKLASR